MKFKMLKIRETIWIKRMRLNCLKIREFEFYGDAEQEKWFFSIIDVIEVLAGIDWHKELNMQY